VLWYEADITQILSPRLDGDSDGNGNDLLYGVLNKKERPGSDFQNALYLVFML